MRARHIRTVVFMAVISVAGIMIMQVIWFKKAFDLKQRQFNHTVFLALQDVSEKIMEYNKIQVPLMGVVNRISSNYYAVNINGEIETSVLEFLLKTEFKKRNISVDFEYGLYNCESEKMVYGNYVSLKEKSTHAQKSRLPVWEKNRYYFCVLFPGMNGYLADQMGIWFFFNGVLLLVCLFFSYTLVIILRQKKLSEIQKDFIDNMTHELKTPISTILVSTQLIKRDEVCNNPVLVNHYTDIITHEATRLRTQVDRVLQIALVDNKRLDLKVQRFNMHACIQEVADSARLLVENRGGHLMVSLLASNPWVMADGGHLTSVIHNLVDNALKYSKGIPEVTIHTENDSKYLFVCIQDRGIGISKENQRKVFEKFYRVPTDNIHDVKGYGLGLFYVKRVVESHNGKVKMESEEGQGCMVRLYLPTITLSGL